MGNDWTVYDGFMALRQRLHQACQKIFEETGHCKSYEGAFTIRLPNMWGYDGWGIHLDCYLVGPHRHYDWEGATFSEAFEKCRRDVEAWIREEEEAE